MGRYTTFSESYYKKHVNSTVSFLRITLGSLLASLHVVFRVVGPTLSAPPVFALLGSFSPFPSVVGSLKVVFGRFPPPFQWGLSCFHLLDFFSSRLAFLHWLWSSRLAFLHWLWGSWFPFIRWLWVSWRPGFQNERYGS